MELLFQRFPEESQKTYQKYQLPQAKREKS
jgi:hypothetical protein